MDATDRQLHARSAALALHAKYGRQTVGAWAYQGKLKRLLLEVDPDGILSETERHQRAKDLERSHMIQLAQKSRTARAARKKQKESTGHFADVLSNENREQP